MRAEPRIVIAGAGAIGCFLGGLWAASGRQVCLLARPRIQREIRAHGLSLTDFSGLARHVEASALDLSADPAVLAQADLVLVTVKSGDTAEMAALIAAHCPVQVPVVSLQNGPRNIEVLRAALPEHDLRGGMVPFNVVPLGQGCFHRASSGAVVIEQGAVDLPGLLALPDLPVEGSAQIDAVLWGKFLVNLTNALNALSGLPLLEMLQDRDWRHLMADQWAEALGVLSAAGIRAQSTTPLPVWLVPLVLRLPTPVFARIAQRMLMIDAQARTSMALDLMAGRKTEIDALQGEVLHLAAAAGRAAPIAALIRELIETAELAGQGLPDLPAAAVRAELQRGAQGQPGVAAGRPL